MAYNASLGEQFEAGAALAERRQQFRLVFGPERSALRRGRARPAALFPLRAPGDKPIRMALDGSDRLHDEPRPFVRLEWGAYLFAPSKKALASPPSSEPRRRARRRAGGLECGDRRDRDRPAARNRNTASARRGHHGLEIRARRSRRRRPTSPPRRSGRPFASVTAAYCARRTAFWWRIATWSHEVFADPQRRLSITGYLPRMRRSFGVLYLGLDPGQEGAYERESEVMQSGHHGASTRILIRSGAGSTNASRCRSSSTRPSMTRRRIGETRWDLTMDVRELLDPLLADFCEEWFGLVAGRQLFPPRRLSLGLEAGRAAELSGPFPFALALYLPAASRTRGGVVRRQARRCRARAMIEFLTQFGATITAPVTRAVLDSATGKADPRISPRGPSPAP